MQAAQATDSQLAKLFVQTGQIDTSHKLIKEYLEDRYSKWYSSNKDWSYPAKVFVALHYSSKIKVPVSCTYFESIPHTQSLFVNPGNQRLIYGHMQNQTVDCVIAHDEHCPPEFLLNPTQQLKTKFALRYHSQSYTPVTDDWHEEDNSWKKFVNVVFQKHVSDMHGTIKIYYKDNLIVDIPNKHNTNNSLNIINAETPFGVWESLESLIGKQEKVLNQFSIKKYG